MSWKWFGFQKMIYSLASTDPEAVVDRARGVMLVYMWSGYVNILKWSLEPLFCTGDDSFWLSPEPPGGFMITHPSIPVRPCD